MTANGVKPPVLFPLPTLTPTGESCSSAQHINTPIPGSSTTGDSYIAANPELWRANSAQTTSVSGTSILARSISKPSALETITSIASSIGEAGGRALIVGGFVRDRLLGLDSKDYDVEVFGLELEELES